VKWTEQEKKVIQVGLAEGYTHEPRPKITLHQLSKKLDMKYQFVEETWRKFRFEAIKEYLKNDDNARALGLK